MLQELFLVNRGSSDCGHIWRLFPGLTKLGWQGEWTTNLSPHVPLKLTLSVSHHCTADLIMTSAIVNRACHADPRLFDHKFDNKIVAAVRHLTKLQDLTMHSLTK